MKRSPIKKKRSKPRPGRLRGDDISDLRTACYVRDGGVCVGCGIRLCLESDKWNTMEMAHIRGKRNHGDSIGNVRALCGPFANGCHTKEHQYGKSMTKPVPRKTV